MSSPRSSQRSVVLGAAFWGGLLLAATIGYARLPSESKTRASDALGQIALLATRGEPRHVIVFPKEFPWLLVGDGIYRRDGFDLLRAGEIVKVTDDAEGRRIEVMFDPAIADRIDSHAKFTAFSSGASIAWTYRSLLPEHVRARITAEWTEFVAANRQRLTEILIPLAKDLLHELQPVIAEETVAALDRHRGEVDAISTRYRDTILKPRLLPLLKDEIWPLVLKHGEPELRATGEDLWAALPVFAIAWQGVAQEFDFSDTDRVKERFDEYLAKDALPILDRHSDALETALVEILKDAAEDPKVSVAVRESITTLLSDQQLRALAVTLIDEIARGDRIRDTIRKRLEEDKTAADTIETLRKDLDELVRRIGRKIVFADETTWEVHPDFARFLRTLVLKKDRRWVYLEFGDGGKLEKDAVIVGAVSAD